MKKLAGIAVAVAGLVSMLISPLAHATAISLTDPTGDVVDRTVGCFAVAAPATCPKDPAAAPGHNQEDLTAMSFEGTAGHYVANFKTVSNWPAQNALATTMPGVSSLEVRYVFHEDAEQNRVENVNYSCTAQNSLPGLGAPQDTDPTGKATIRWDTQNCSWLQEGPFPRTDGFTFFIGIVDKVVGGKFQWSWEYGWFEELTAIFYSNPGSTSNDLFNSDVATVGSGSATTSFANLPTGALGDSSTNGITLRVPYALRNDFPDDHDPSTSEVLTDYLGRAGDTVNGVTAAVYATVAVQEPDPKLCPASTTGYGVIPDPAGGVVGGVVAPILVGNAPSGFNDPKNCYQQGAGVTIVGDWIPGNPYQTGGPFWGGFKPRDLPRAPSFLPGAASPGNINGLTCNYPAGLADLQPWVGYAPDRVSGAGAATYVNGVTVSYDGSPLAHVPALSPASGVVAGVNQPLPTGQSHACGNIFLQQGLHFYNASGTTPIT